MYLSCEHMYSRTSNSNAPSTQSQSQSQYTAKPTMNHCNSNPHTAPKPTRLVYELQHQARVRSGHDFSSLHVTDLPEGTMVLVDQIVHNRARITIPIHGWISVFSRSGLQIIRKVNKETQKIGGKAIFPVRIPTNDNNPNTYKSIRIQCKIVDYNERYNMHKVQSKNGNQRWISLHDPNITYVPKNNRTRSEKVYPTKQTEALFEQFFCADYPQFAPNIGGGGNVQTISNYNPLKQEDTVSEGTPCDHDEERKEEETHSTVVTEETEHDITCNDEESEETKEYEPPIETASSTTTQPPNGPEFVSNDALILKLKEIEERIVNHLHLRGYYEDNPDFWRYIAKAKEIAIVKVQKERQKWLESTNRNNYVY